MAELDYTYLKLMSTSLREFPFCFYLILLLLCIFFLLSFEFKLFLSFPLNCTSSSQHSDYCAVMKTQKISLSLMFIC